MTEYQDYRYVLQNTGGLYIGAKFKFADVIKEEEVPFKFRTIIAKYALEEVDGEDTFESVLYYMKPEGFLYQVLLQLRTKVKVSELTDVKCLFGRHKLVYKERIYSLKEFVELSKSEKEKIGIVVQEAQFSKLAIMAFSV